MKLNAADVTERIQAMLFITNRFPTKSIEFKENRDWNFDMDNNGSSNSVFFCETGPIVTTGDTKKRR